MQEKEHLELVFLSKYFPYMNIQENVWNYLKAKVFKPSSRSSIEELISDREDIFYNLNNNVDRINSLVYARKILV